ncbi:MAG: ATP-dependent ligase [Rhodoglobus sp.]|nr:ATP-dependent ligase [Rhodoglobus sp.]
MGSLIYGTAAIEVKFEDRVLAHLQVVMSAKLRRGESFFFSWFDDPSVGDGRSAVWVDPAIPLYFRYSGSRPPTLNKLWLEELAIAAGSNQGLVLLEEPGADGVVRAEDNSVKRKDNS